MEHIFEFSKLKNPNQEIRKDDKRLVQYLEKQKKIDERQFDFRKQKSTIDAISKITTQIPDGFRRKEKTAAIFFDSKKAYEMSTEIRHLNNWKNGNTGKNDAVHQRTNK